MATRETDSRPRTISLTHEASSHALGIVTALALAAGFAMVAAWFALLLLDERRPAPVAHGTMAPCSVCGVVQSVREVAPAPGQALEGSRAEGAVILLAALGGALAPGARPSRIFETSVIHDDGSVRVLRDSAAPQWRRGDRVKVIKGRVESAASPAERTPSPVPPVARVP